MSILTTYMPSSNHSSVPFFLEPKMNQFRDTTNDFYKDLQAGRVDQKDFERHIYGQYGEKSYHKDDKDRAD